MRPTRHTTHHRSRRTIRTCILAVAGLIGLIGLAGCGTEGGGASGPSPDRSTMAATSRVTVQQFAFRPARLAVAPGTEATWTNRDQILHTVTAGTPEAPTGAFEVVLDGANSTGRARFDRRGTFAYFCSRHNGMRGEVTVG